MTHTLHQTQHWRQGFRAGERLEQYDFGDEGNQETYYAIGVSYGNTFIISDFVLFRAAQSSIKIIVETVHLDTDGGAHNRIVSATLIRWLSNQVQVLNVCCDRLFREAGND